MEDRNNVSWVVKNGLCTGCGTCTPLCPKNAIQMKIEGNKGIYLPDVNASMCNYCGICLKVCPGHEADLNGLNDKIFGKRPENPLIGNYLNCYVGYSTDHEVRYNCSSGGIITQTLIYALEEKLIDGALVTRMKKDKPLEPEPFIARTKEEIYEARGSKYCPVPANIALKEILDAPEGQKFAVVGLPCHIQGIRKAEQINKKLKERIVLHLGIFCNHTPSLNATGLLIDKLNIKKEDVREIRYRGEGWPGKMMITKRDGNEVIVPNCWSFIGSPFFYPTRCLSCTDALAELSDISLGDAWLKEYSGDTVGTSIIILKNKNSAPILDNAMAHNDLEIKPIPVSDLIMSQRNSISMKRELNSSSASSLNNIGNVPSSFTGAMVSAYIKCALRIGQSPRIMKIVPASIVRASSLPLMVIRLKNKKYAGGPK